MVTSKNVLTHYKLSMFTLCKYNVICNIHPICITDVLFVSVYNYTFNN